MPSEILQESEQVAILTDELQQVRKEVVERQEIVDTLRGQLTTMQEELEHCERLKQNWWLTISTK